MGCVPNRFVEDVGGPARSLVLDRVFSPGREEDGEGGCR